MEFDDIVLPTYVINLKERTDRYRHIQQQFERRTEFDLHIIEASKGDCGAVALWDSMCRVINLAIQHDEDVILLCEDDHTFTPSYNKHFLFRNILEAGLQGVELLSGGIGGFNHAVPVSENRYWVDSLWCTQFIVLYRPIFSKMLNLPFLDTDTADGVLSLITSNKMVVYPFVSVQLDFGYSDVSPRNHNERGLITGYFKQAALRLEKYRAVYNRYLKDK